MTHKKPEEIQGQLKIIDGYKTKGKATLVFLCDPYSLPEFHRLHIEEVVLNKKTDIYKPPGSKDYALHLGALEMLGNKAGIEWIPSVTDAKSISSTIIHYIATGFYTREYGKRVSVQGEGLSDLDVIKDDLEFKYKSDAKKYEKDQGWIDYCVNRDFRAKRNKRLQLARAEACAQVYRKLLGLGGTYPEKLFDHPIIIIRTVVAPDYRDPETQKLLREAGINASLGIYGPNPGHQIGLPAPEIAVSEKGDYTGDETETIIPEGETEEEDPSLDFKNSDVEVQFKALETLIRQKAYEFNKGLSLETLHTGRYLALFELLSGMPDQDIPL